MDFFEQQHRARRYTVVMVLMFLAAVAAIVLSVNVVGGYVYLVAMERPLLPAGRALAAVPHSAYVVTTLVILGIVAWGTLTRTYELSGGGAAVANMVGARWVKRDSQNPPERRLLNIVEEMALASGISVPQVYVMDDEREINAFTAGYSPNEAAVVVTRGALENLDRDELQGVVAHEFSHILNGDMRLNIRLLGVIAGLVLIGAVGGFLMRLGSGGDSGGDRRGRGDVRLLLIGLVLWLLGAIGVFAGRLIKAAVSRQREFLADASAVQFTRNPEGLGGALYKIGQRGSVIAARHAEELSHMCIALPVGAFLDFDWFSTHPPLEERIERVMGPGAELILSRRESRRVEAPAQAAPEKAVSAPGAPAPEAMIGLAGAAGAAFGRAASTPLQVTPQALMASIGAPSTAHADLARELLQRIPGDLRAAVGAADGAQAVLFAMLLGEGAARAGKLALLEREAGVELATRTAACADLLRRADLRVRMPLLDLAIPALKALAQPERDRILRIVAALIQADGKVTTGSFVLLTICKRHLSKDARGAPPVKHKSIETAAAEAGVVFSLLALAGNGGQSAFDKGTAALGLGGSALRAPAELGFPAVEDALYELKLLAPLKKPQFIKACLAVVMADGRLRLAEGELMRAICAALDTPLPPIIETGIETGLKTTETAT